MTNTPPSSELHVGVYTLLEKKNYNITTKILSRKLVDVFGQVTLSKDIESRHFVATTANTD